MLWTMRCNRGKFPGKQSQHFPLAIARLSNIKHLRDRSKCPQTRKLKTPNLPGLGEGAFLKLIAYNGPPWLDQCRHPQDVTVTG